MTRGGKKEVSKLELDLLAIRDRNAQRAREAIEKLGTKWLCHPVNRVERKRNLPGILSRGELN